MSQWRQDSPSSDSARKHMQRKLCAGGERIARRGFRRFVRACIARYQFEMLVGNVEHSQLGGVQHRLSQGRICPTAAKGSPP